MPVADGAILKVVAQSLFPTAVLVQNVFNVVFADTGASNDDADVVDDLVDWMDSIYDNLNAVVNTGIDGDQVFVYKFDPTDVDWDEVGTAAWTWNPTSATDMVPHGVAAVLNAVTTEPDVQGRKFFAGIVEDEALRSTLQATALAALAAAGADWITPFVGAATGGDFAPTIWSPKTTTAWLISSVLVNTIVGYQRRRKPGVGI